MDLGYLPYLPAFAIQEQVFEARLEGRLPTVIILQENPPTFTVGRSGSANGGIAGNLLASPEELSRRGFEILEVNRGGDVTYHGPGQIIASPLFYLGDIENDPANCPNANAYLHRLEDVLIEVLAHFNISAGKVADQPGVWIGAEKIGAVGIAVRHGYTFHGLSLNVNLDLSPFSLINPCGVPQMRVTSMQAQLGETIPFDEVKSKLRLVMSATFGIELQDGLWKAQGAAVIPVESDEVIGEE